MFKVLDILRIGDIHIVSVEGDTSLLKNNLKLIDEKENIFEIDTVGMPHYKNLKDNRMHAELVLQGDIDKIGKTLQVINGDESPVLREEALCTH